MKLGKVKVLAAGLAIMVLGVISVTAQTNPNLESGTHNFGSYHGGDIDSVNLVHGGVDVKIPLTSYPQRGGHLAMENFFQNSGKKWGVQQIAVRSGNGFSMVYPWVGNGFTKITDGSWVNHSANIAVGRTRTVTSSSNEGGSVINETDFNYWVGLPDGSVHNLDGVQPASTSNSVSVAVDTSGFQFTLIPGVKADHSDDSGVLVDRHGTHYYYPKLGVLAGNVVAPNLPWLQGYNYKVWAGDPGSVTQYNDVSWPTSIVDANGNTITIGAVSTASADTLGRGVVGDLGMVNTNPTSDYSGCSSSRPITAASVVNYPGVNGGAYPVKLCFGTVNIATAFSQPSNGQQAPNVYTTSPWTVVVSIALPDQSHWSLDYDNYGNVTSITYPTGGQVSYQWQEISMPYCADGTLTPVSRAVSTRTLFDGTNSRIWQYSWGQQQSDGTLTNIVTDPNGNDTAHVMSPVAVKCGFYETETRYYQGLHTSGTLLKTVDTTYSGSEGSLNTIATNVVPTSVTTKLPNGKVSQVTWQHDAGIPGTAQVPSGVSTFGNVTVEKVYDYGKNAPGPLLRETDTTYVWQSNNNYLNAGLLDLPASVIIKDSNGNRVAETDYVYDEPAYLTAYTGTLPQGTHGAAPGGTVRGNLTTVSKWLNTSSSPVVSHSNWYDTGEVYQQIDPLGNTTTHSYDPAYAGAYSTKTCNALSQCVSGTYDFDTGLLTSFTNVNASQQANGNTPGDANHTWNYTYNDPLERLTQAQAPPDASKNRPTTTFNYPSATTIERLKSITSSLNEDSFVDFDGVGRVIHSRHITPGGPAKVDTTYDGLDRVLQVTNPYFSTSDPTYGVIQTQYDALGRVKQVTRQDGSTSSVAYDVASPPGVQGDCLTATDEAGKQRQTCSDALGRLVEVDEPGDNFAGAQAEGSLAVSGTLQSTVVGAHGVTQASGSVSIQSGASDGLSDVSIDNPSEPCPPFPQQCPQLWDRGWISITINGITSQVGYGQSSNVNTLISGLVSAINSGGVGAYVHASPGNFAVTLQAQAAGSAGNYGLSGASDSSDVADFGGPSFTAVPSAASLTGGTDANPGTTIYDAGTVTITIGSFSASAPYSQSGNRTAAMVASALISSSNPNNLNRSGSPVTASGSGSTLNITYASIGASGNVPVSCSSSTSQGTYFPSPSFVCPTITLSAGQNAEGPSLDHNYFVTQYGYDTLGNLLNVTQKGDPTVTSSSQWRVRSFTYDSLSRLLTATNPESGQISYSYDADGNMLQKTSPAPNQTGSATQTISYCYDKLNRVTGKAHSAQTCANGQLPSGTAVVTYAYDAGANGIGHLTSLTDQAGSGSYSFDALGRIGSESRTIAGIQKNLAYTYNLDNSVATLTYPSGAVVTYTPDSAGRIASAVDSGSNINYITGATYGPDSALTGFVSGNSSSFAGITNTFSYNTRLQPCRLSATTGTQPASCTDGTNIGNVIDLSYDFHLGSGNNGNVFRLVNNKDLSRIQTFTYDALNRLTSAQNAGTDCTKTTVNGKTAYWGNTYGYDPWGNLLQKTVTKCSAENLSVTALANNQLSGYSYDAAGNMTHDATTGNNYTFDAENRITGAAGFTYTYDADGNRVEKSNGSTGTIYWYMSPGIVGESDLSGALQSEYVFFDGERVARKDFPGNAVSYYFSDHLKTASVITNAAGTIKEDEDYYPWGGELQFVNNDSNHYKFTGKERDAETGLDYFGARYYGNRLGRWMSPDWAAKPEAVPYSDLHDPQSLNLYSYVRNIPTTRIDGDGHDDDDGPVMKWLKSLIQPAMDVHSSKDGSRAIDNSRVDPVTNTTNRQVVADATDKVATGAEVMATIASFADFSGLGNAGHSMARKDPVGALMGMAFVHIPGGGSIGMTEAKSLVGEWSKGGFETVADSLRYHHGEHGAEVGAKNVWQYMRKADGFKQNLKGAAKSSIPGSTPGVTRYAKKGKYIDLDTNGKIISFGKAN